MNKTSIIKTLGGVALISVMLAGCAGTGAMGDKTSPHKEQLLTQAGFKIKTVTTDKQKKQLATLISNKVSAVMYKGKLYYAYPDVAHNQVYVGKQPEYNTYKHLLGQRAAGEGPDSSMVEETAGPNRIVINRFDAWGPLGE